MRKLILLAMVLGVLIFGFVSISMSAKVLVVRTWDLFIDGPFSTMHIIDGRVQRGECNYQCNDEDGRTETQLDGVRLWELVKVGWRIVSIERDGDSWVFIFTKN